MATSLLLFVTVFVSSAILCQASPQAEPQSNMAVQGGAMVGGGGGGGAQPMRPNDFWNWRSNPAYSDYWQREMARRQWSQRPGAAGGYYPGATAGPDSQYTYKTYDNPEFYGYDSVFPGGRAHFIGYKTQGGKRMPSDWSQDQNMKRPSYLNSPVTQPAYPSNPQQNFKRK
ncbi:hypothetical protein LSTR_LSTR012172 [Laodelphax striatellus]|uniref:Uncharacterized protein n=1 Tax=Laodelphax striatellus TaxID=195883 RepID=A0A482WXP1_LAOST|nr:hypothetical protein LSTR_LSTR012172 [Laodelphax striatellus]